MNLQKGWVPHWRDDLLRYFTRAPFEYALFGYFMANAQYGNSYTTFIRGKNYSQWHTIEIGDVYTSKEQIKDFWGFHHTTLKKTLKNLQDAALIEVLLENPTLIVRIKNYAYFSFAGKPEDRNTPAEVNTPPAEVNTPPALLYHAILGGTKNPNSADDGVEQKRIQCNKETNKQKDNNKEREEQSLPVFNLYTFDEMEIGDTWYRWASIREPTFHADDYIKAVSEMRKKFSYSYADIFLLLEFVANSDFYAPHFLSPSCITTMYKNGTSLIGNAFTDMKNRKRKSKKVSV